MDGKLNNKESTPFTQPTSRLDKLWKEDVASHSFISVYLSYHLCMILFPFWNELGILLFSIYSKWPKNDFENGKKECGYAWASFVTVAPRKSSPPPCR